MTDSDLSTITERCAPEGPVSLTPIGTLYGTGNPALVLRACASLRLYAVRNLSEFDVLVHALNGR